MEIFYFGVISYYHYYAWHELEHYSDGYPDQHVRGASLCFMGVDATLIY